MLHDKEYPATHSMDTAWYIADEDGNVGIMDFNDNGPVPWQAEQTSVEELVFGHEEDYETKEYNLVNLTDEQIDELIHSPHSPEGEDLWMDCIIQIDVENENEFLKLAKNSDFDLEFCVSQKRGLYSVDAYHCTSETQKDGKYQILEASSLRKMLDKKIILQVFKKKSFWMNDEWVDEKVVHTKEFDKAPYYIFHQPYWTGELPVCMNIPDHPVKLEQISESLKKRILRVPLKFKETERFQIAEWHPCSSTICCDTPVEVVNACEYTMLPLTDGTYAYICSEVILPAEFFHYCSEREKYNCAECGWGCHSWPDHCFTDKPTLLVITHPLEEWDYSRQIKSDSLIPFSLWLSFLPKIPFKIRCKPSQWSSRKYENFPSEKDIRKHVSGHKLLELFRKNKRWLEDQVARFNPRVILVSGAAEAIMKAVYPIKDNRIEINGVSYQMYILSEVEAHRKEIERLAAMPYQGKKIPHIISVEEMEKIKQGND